MLQTSLSGPESVRQAGWGPADSRAPTRPTSGISWRLMSPFPKRRPGQELGRSQVWRPWQEICLLPPEPGSENLGSDGPTVLAGCHVSIGILGCAGGSQPWPDLLDQFGRAGSIVQRSSQPWAHAIPLPSSSTKSWFWVEHQTWLSKRTEGTQDFNKSNLAQHLTVMKWISKAILCTFALIQGTFLVEASCYRETSHWFECFILELDLEHFWGWVLSTIVQWLLHVSLRLELGERSTLVARSLGVRTFGMKSLLGH